MDWDGLGLCWDGLRQWSDMSVGCGRGRLWRVLYTATNKDSPSKRRLPSRMWKAPAHLTGISLHFENAAPSVTVCRILPIALSRLLLLTYMPSSAVLPTFTAHSPALVWAHRPTKRLH